MKPGVFALVNGLARDGRLSEVDLAWRLEANAWFEGQYTDPSTVDPSVYDPAVHPLATSWFRADAVHLTNRVREYLTRLDRYGVPWEQAESSSPGRIIYEGDVQVVVVPLSRRSNWRVGDGDISDAGRVAAERWNGYIAF
jgi:hypothetical protein